MNVPSSRVQLIEKRIKSRQIMRLKRGTNQVFFSWRVAMLNFLAACAAARDLSDHTERACALIRPTCALLTVLRAKRFARLSDLKMSPTVIVCSQSRVLHVF